MYLEHLESLSILRQDKDVKVEVPEDKPEWKSFRWYTLTEFGHQFIGVCIQNSNIFERKGKRNL